MQSAHTLSPEELLSCYSVDSSQGLTAAQVSKSRTEHGRNELPKEESASLLSLILEQFKDQLVLILLASAVISFILAIVEEDDSGTAFVEPIVILLILIANATVGVIQETNAEKAIEALMEYSPDEAKVIRDGKTAKIHSGDIVPGDIIMVTHGDKVPADCRVLQIYSASFTIDQALLTGESVSVSKTTEAIVDKNKNAVKQDMINTLFSGTTVVAGSAKAIVTKTGSQTAIGHIHHSITNQISEKTPLKQKLDDFGDLLAKVITVICILVWLVNINNFTDPAHHGWLKGAIYYFKIAVALAVAAIPEGLAVVITTCLALGTKKMAKKNAIVRSLPSVETLGCTQVICADKTGTLTTNQMSVSQIVLAQGNDIREFSVQGSTFSPKGSICSANGQRLIVPATENSNLALLSKISALCNDAKINFDPSTGTYSKVGEATEAALIVLSEKLGTGNAQFDQKIDAVQDEAQRVNAVCDKLASDYPRLLTFEFSRDRKSMSVLVKNDDNDKASLYVKGAPESVLERCTTTRTEDGKIVPLSESLRGRLLDMMTDSGRKGLRNLALAARLDVDADPAHYKTSSPSEYVNFEQDLTFIGLVGMLDPPRPEVKGAIEKCRTAGIRIIVITGDDKNTAETICRQIGLFGHDEDLTGKSYTGKEFSSLPEEHQKLAVHHASLFSRTDPNHKRVLVDLLQASGLVVAMTGDGVNDAPALKRAAIGIAMGSGTDVAKLASDMVLADDNFASIELAVEEGRSIYENTKQFIRYLISSNIGEVVSIFLTVLLGMPEALIPVQLLWVNLVTDGLPATALAFSPADHSIMLRPPRNPREPLVGLGLFIRYLVIGTYVGLATVGGYAWWFMYYQGGPQISFYQLTHFHQCPASFPEIGCEMFSNIMSRRATSVSLSILVTIEMANAMNSLSEIESLLTMPLWTNMYLVGAIILSMILHFVILYVPFFANLFVVTPLNWEEWKAVLYISLPIILIDEAFKFYITRFTNVTRAAKTTSKKTKTL